MENKKTFIRYGDGIDDVLRRISGTSASLISKYNVSPNSVTLFRAALMPLVMYLFFKAQMLSIFFAGLLLQFYDLLDYVDGDLARLTNKTSKLGQWLEYFDNVFQGTLGSLLGFFIVLGVFRKTEDPSIWIVLFFLCFGILVKKVLIFIPIKAESWVFNLAESSSFKDFKHEMNKSFISKLGKIILSVSTRDLGVIFLISILSPLWYNTLGLNVVYYTLIIVACAHNLTWMGIAFYQLKFIIKNK